MNQKLGFRVCLFCKCCLRMKKKMPEGDRGWAGAPPTPSAVRVAELNPAKRKHRWEILEHQNNGTPEVLTARIGGQAMGQRAVV